MSTRGTSTRKRARTGSIAAASNDGATPEPGNVGAASRKRDEEFWYEDGSIILVARDVEFRVFKGILAEHSPVFRDMFSLPQPQGDASSSTGTSRDVEHPCPIVHLSDSPEDLRHVLRAYMPKDGPRYIWGIVRRVGLTDRHSQRILSKRPCPSLLVSLDLRGRPARPQVSDVGNPGERT